MMKKWKLYVYHNKLQRAHHPFTQHPPLESPTWDVNVATFSTLHCYPPTTTHDDGDTEKEQQQQGSKLNIITTIIVNILLF